MWILCIEILNEKISNNAGKLIEIVNMEAYIDNLLRWYWCALTVNFKNHKWTKSKYGYIGIDVSTSKLCLWTAIFFPRGEILYNAFELIGNVWSNNRHVSELGRSHDFSIKLILPAERTKVVMYREKATNKIVYIAWINLWVTRVCRDVMYCHIVNPGVNSLC